MKDYSPLFNQGLLALASDAHTFLRCSPSPSHPIAVVTATKPLAPSTNKKRTRAEVGRSFLNLKTSVYVDGESFKTAPMSASASMTTFSSASPSSKPSSPSSRALPLPKPAPLASLPAIPIAISISTTSPNPTRPTSPVPSSTIQPSSSTHRKHQSLASATSSSVSSAYRKRRRQDALHALEGKRPATAPTSFVPRIDEEDEHQSVKEDLAAPVSPRPVPRLRSHLSFGSSMYPTRGAAGLKSPTTPAFSAISFDLPPQPTLHRRASTTAVNFIDLDDDAASSIWRWSHVA